MRRINRNVSFYILSLYSHFTLTEKMIAKQYMRLSIYYIETMIAFISVIATLNYLNILFYNE